MQNNDVRTDGAAWLTRYRDAGYSFFNTGSHQKKVLTDWKKYQTQYPTNEEIQRWLALPTQNYAIVCGSVSNLVVFDVDTKNGGDPAPFLHRGFYEVRTPSGGYHFYFLYDEALANTKHKKADHAGILKAVDVQSNGSLVFAPPSAFDWIDPKTGTTAHVPYTLAHDACIGKLPDDLLAEVLEALEPREADSNDIKPFRPVAMPEMGRPGDIFNALATWDDLLLPLGWSKVGRPQKSGTQFWRRPGKTDGISASTNWQGFDLFFVYTTHYEELVPFKGYSKFRLYATLHHKANYGEAAKALVMENYRLAHNLHD